jgi:hypothetical protein
MKHAHNKAVILFSNEARCKQRIDLHTISAFFLNDTKNFATLVRRDVSSILFFESSTN